MATLTPFQGYGGGLSLGAADVDDDGRDEILVGAIAGAGPHVKALGVDGTEKRSFFAFDQGFLGGVTVGTNSANDVVVGAGSSAPASSPEPLPRGPRKVLSGSPQRRRRRE